jgi:hypothetical protein
MVNIPSRPVPTFPCRPAVSPVVIDLFRQKKKLNILFLFKMERDIVRHCNGKQKVNETCQVNCPVSEKDVAYVAILPKWNESFELLWSKVSPSVRETPTG